jgi:hypothetical protein
LFSEVELLVHFHILNQHYRVEIEILNIYYQITTAMNHSQNEKLKLTIITEKPKSQPGYIEVLKSNMIINKT